MVVHFDADWEKGGERGRKVREGQESCPAACTMQDADNKCSNSSMAMHLAQYQMQQDHCGDMVNTHTHKHTLHLI